MKKLKKLFVLVLFAFILSSCGNSKDIKNLSYSNLKDKMNNKETFFLVVIRDGCQYCESFVPKVKEVLNEYDTVGYTLNFTELSEEETQEFDKDYDVTNTPTTIFFKDGKEISVLQRVIGNVSKEKLIDKLKDLDYIK